MVSQFNSYIEFLEFYLQGLMNEGLLTPLFRFSLLRSDIAGQDARKIYDLHLGGKSPQEAILNSEVKMPQILKDLLILGFEKSVVDLVIADVVAVLKSNNTDQIMTGFADIKSKYSKIDVDAICAGCAAVDVNKIIERAKVEGAKEVIIEQDGDFMVQKYLGPKLVVMREAAVPAVYASLKAVIHNQHNTIQIKFQ